MNAQDIRERFASLRAKGMRHKDAAAAMGLPEGAAVAAHTGAHDKALSATRLRGPWVELLQALELCGPVLALTRNETTVHEKTGVYEKVSGSEAMGLALGEAIDLRLFFSRWHAGFAVSEAAANAGVPPSLSLQFFDAQGVAVHKIFARDATDRDAFQSVVASFTAPDEPVAFVPAEAKAAPLEDSAIDVGGLSDAWRAMQDTHEFFGLLNKFKVERQQSFRLTEGEFTQRAEPSAVRELLQEASFDGTPIMVFVGSPGCIQIHSGPVVRIEPLEMRGADENAPPIRWLNVLDPGFNLHLREDRIASVWIVEKPTSDGIVTSVEAFDGSGELMAMFFGARKPGVPEREEWRRIVSELPRLQPAAQQP
ncbi:MULTISPECIES: hemin-degrading factor [Variovorax]|jgi:putative hemin transport protein|uniref:hemin-degrading factor n=1 Tax=Variovorax TaxID=34072 RepID=UPI00086AF157|nr:MULTISPECIES: ChuX/HutX family heme-like substrate-binding protein [Variovorax]MBN8753455.1 hemin-degrading factor [Variovorax sp.]ODU15739.1 MAG: hemin receptor [Variovorax sp. SCN 67-85]ODV27587.1 MAG: hemin receptor [Variovorax sp. SCN 67-20]OJZ11472.1 MAG: hemin-degrading factor [Variovorax sp. 67-131]UKI05882.1 hemin-degrading factor [Variovorax paradoxus]